MPRKTQLQQQMEEQSSAPDGVERVFLAGVDMEREAARPSSAPEAGLSSARQARSAAESGLPDSLSTGVESIPFSAAESLAELAELARSAGGVVVGEMMQRRERPDPATLIGSGKLAELKGAVASSGATLTIFDHELTPSQLRNLEKELSVRVIDRTQLILDIFAARARTREGQLQVEKAQLDYLLPRLTGRGASMSQTGGGIGTRGPGETQLESDRRKIRRRIKAVEEQLAEVRKVRAQQRRRRESTPVPTVALVGYTNAGKSTLFNALTGAGVYADDRLFATLDPTLRDLRLPTRRPARLSDTVGFLRNLPHTLVDAFRATLEEVERAQLLLLVVDASSPVAREQLAQVEEVLAELGCAEKPRLQVVNKVDLLTPSERVALRDKPEVVHISAADGRGLSRLLEAIDEHLTDDPMRPARLRVPQAEGRVLSELAARAQIIRRVYEGEEVSLELLAPESVLRRLERFVIAESQGSVG